MAGVMLLIAKNREAQSQLISAENTLKKANNTLYMPYFERIVYSRNENYLLVQYKKTGSSDIYFSKEGWIAIEGNAFDLNSEKIFSMQELWELYKTQDDGFVNNLDGHFVIKLYDKSKDKYLVFNDIIKSRTNFLVETKNFYMITPFLLTTALLKDPQLDPYALNELLWRYYILSEKSIFKNVKRLSPASIYTFDSISYSYKEYWQFPQQVASGKMDYYVDSMVENILQSTRIIQKISENPVSDLTLGQDSRLIAGAFLKNEIPFSTTTFGDDSFSEVDGVKSLSGRHNIEHHTIKLDNLTIEEYDHFFKTALLIGSGDEPGYLLGRILYMRQQQQQYGKGIVNGSGGPFYKDCFWEEIYILNLYHPSRRINSSMFLKLRPMNSNYYDAVFNTDFMKIKENSSQYFLEMLYNDLEGYQHLPLSMQIDKFSLHRWQNYAVMPNDAANKFTHSFSPLQFRRNLEIGLPLPPGWKWNKSNFQRKVMHQINPALAKEKTDFGGINMVPKNPVTFIPFYMRYSWKQSTRMRNKIANRLGFSPKTHLQKAWDYLPIYQDYFRHPSIRENIKLHGSQMGKYLDNNEWQEWINSFSENTPLTHYEQLFKITGTEYLFKAAQLFRNDALK